MANPNFKNNDVSYEVDPQTTQDIKERNALRRQRLRRRFVIRRVILGVIATIIIIVPIIVIAGFLGAFDARIYVKYIGDGKPNVTNEELSVALIDLNKKNVFRISESLVKEKMAQIPYVEEDDIVISKSYIPARVTIFYDEASPYGYYKVGDEFLAFGADGRVVEHFTKAPANIPLVTNMNDTYVTRDDALNMEDPRVEALLLCLARITHYGFIDKVEDITVDADEFITFNYDNCYEIKCGSTYQIDSKIGLLEATLKNTSMGDSPKGTIDLSTVGKAIYSP